MGSIINCTLLEVPNKVYKFKISTDPNSEEIIIFENFIISDSLLFTKSIQNHQQVLYFLEDGKISFYEKSIDDTNNVSKKFELNDPEDSIRHLLFIGNNQVVITNRKIITLRNWELEDDMTIKDTTRIYGAAVSPNKCCLCLITCNK